MADSLDADSLDADSLDRVLAAAAAAAHEVAAVPLKARAAWLRAIADDLEAAKDELIALAQTETHLPVARLTGEVGRTSFQLRLTADAVVEGSWLELTVDHADPDWPTGPRPDLRRWLRPVGPVLVVAASNFPFAFSVAGGDTASALGAGCPVILKAHPGHRELSTRTAALVGAALQRAGAPAGTFALIEGEADTQTALRDPRVKAASFTGSVRGGRALFDIASTRPDPIPFYGELGSVNPAFVLPSAIAERRTETLEGFVASFTMGVGQFCTKPGILFVPRTPDLIDELAALVGGVGGSQLLNERIGDGFAGRLDDMRGRWSLIQEGDGGPEGVTPTLFSTSLENATTALDALWEESFGPTAVVVEYDDPADLVGVARLLPGQLTATVHADEDDPTAQPLLSVLAGHAGRIVWNGWPTGVSVSWAMQHGGSWPATTASLHTSVGPTALRRFVQPVAYQNVPASLLPTLLQEQDASVWRRVDGALTAPAPVDG